MLLFLSGPIEGITYGVVLCSRGFAAGFRQGVCLQYTEAHFLHGTVGAPFIAVRRSWLPVTTTVSRTLNYYRRAAAVVHARSKQGTPLESRGLLAGFCRIYWADCLEDTLGLKAPRGFPLSCCLLFSPILLSLQTCQILGDRG